MGEYRTRTSSLARIHKIPFGDSAFCYFAAFFRFSKRKGPSEPSGAIVDDPVLAKTHMTAKRACVLAAEEDQNDACEDEMNAPVEFLTTEPAICPTP